MILNAGTWCTAAERRRAGTGAACRCARVSSRDRSRNPAASVSPPPTADTEAIRQEDRGSGWDGARWYPKPADRNPRLRLSDWSTTWTRRWSRPICPVRRTGHQPVEESKILFLVTIRIMPIFHGRVNTFGSSTVTAYVGWPSVQDPGRRHQRRCRQVPESMPPSPG